MEHLRYSHFEEIVHSLTDLQATYDDGPLTFVLNYSDGEVLKTYSFYRALLFISMEFHLKNQRANSLSVFPYCDSDCVAKFEIDYDSNVFHINRKK